MVTMEDDDSLHAARHWCFTINNYDEELIQLTFDSWKRITKYLVFGFETGESGTPHVQGYMALKVKRRLTALKTLHPGAHWEISRGTPDQASLYCKKDGKFIEWGVLPVTSGQATAVVWEDIHELAKERDMQGFLDRYKALSFLHLRCFKELMEAYQTVPSSLPLLENYWFLGASGTGKSRTARARYPQHYLKPTATKWWNGYDGQDTVIIDDLGKDHGYVMEWLKTWSDHYPFQAETKGAHTGLIRPKRFVITTQYEMEEITQDQKLLEAIRRRFTLVKFGNGLGEQKMEVEKTDDVESDVTWLDEADLDFSDAVTID